MNTDPTADLTDDDVRRVCDEADMTIDGKVSARDAEIDRRFVCKSVLVDVDDVDPTWGWACCAAVARLRAERAERGTRRE